MNGRIELVRSRKGFYRENYNRACVGLLLALVTILLLSVLVIYQAIFRPTAATYATLMNGDVIRLFFLNAPLEQILK